MCVADNDFVSMFVVMKPINLNWISLFYLFLLPLFPFLSLPPLPPFLFCVS